VKAKGILKLTSPQLCWREEYEESPARGFDEKPDKQLVPTLRRVEGLRLGGRSRMRPVNLSAADTIFCSI
jgi:hypothetical protein